MIRKDTYKATKTETNKSGLNAAVTAGEDEVDRLEGQKLVELELVSSTMPSLRDFVLDNEPNVSFHFCENLHISKQGSATQWRGKEISSE